MQPTRRLYVEHAYNWIRPTARRLGGRVTVRRDRLLPPPSATGQHLPGRAARNFLRNRTDSQRTSASMNNTVSQAAGTGRQVGHGHVF